MSEDRTVATPRMAERVATSPESPLVQDPERWVGTSDLISLGVAADEARRRRHDDRVTFVQVLDAPLGQLPEGPIPEQAGEVRVTGRLDSPADMLAAVRAAVGHAGVVPVTGFAFADLDEVSGHDPARLGDLLSGLREAGLTLIDELCVEGLEDPDRALTLLLDSGMRVSRITLGTASGEAALPLMRHVASWGAVGAVCRCVAPLPRLSPSPPSTGYADLRQVALARLLVDNIESIQVDWSRYGPKLAQVALTFGADDVDAVAVAGVVEQGWRRSPGEEIRRNITGAGFTAVPRNARFERLTAVPGSERG